MRKLFKLTIVGALLSMNTFVFASESSHFKGGKVENLSEAVQAFSEQNKKFAAIIEKGSIELKEMGDIHQMTYSMENALRKIKAEVAEMEVLLEEVHEASEHGEKQKVLKEGQKYLEKAQTLVP
ncbi:DUF6746 family protein [Thiomicrorhabdus lithotrophica]|uniref:Soluble cytochrome b562 n=1 Tax=Thiomicrorhabdus lithotrophica TaxID=2949997 RepID=A0ABY8CCC1_9GAMM|nr:DUF6746 family protein [Thiomicrorhabdus lithotrophica]WEJ62437.1 hypothetical protein NR989_10535 [Thiomicrorhabdus lithotrophica]